VACHMGVDRSKLTKRTKYAKGLKHRGPKL
jgi:hypothetical protein